AANAPIQRHSRAKLLVLDSNGRISHAPRSALADFLRIADLVVANDSATLPASLVGIHERSGQAIEVRLAGCRALTADGAKEFTAIVFGAGDFRTRTEDRPAPPELLQGDIFVIGPLRAIALRTLDHPRLVALRCEG